MSHWTTSFFILHSLEYQQSEKSTQLYAGSSLDASADRNVTPIPRAEPTSQACGSDRRASLPQALPATPLRRAV